MEADPLLSIPDVRLEEFCSREERPADSAAVSIPFSSPLACLLGKNWARPFNVDRLERSRVDTVSLKSTVLVTRWKLRPTEDGIKKGEHTSSKKNSNTLRF